MSSNVQHPNFPYCRVQEETYEKINKIGEGTFGEVFKARDKKTNKVVAMKELLMENESQGFPIATIREIKALQLLKHENVVSLIEICRTVSKGNQRTIYLVFEFCKHNLATVLSNGHVEFTLGEIKTITQQLLQGLQFIHANGILHRSMKPANILITKRGVLKLAEFGLARVFGSKNTEQSQYSNHLVPLWYRPPELLLGEQHYGPAIDMWSAGCILTEMWTRSPIMQGDTEEKQLTLISTLCGSITPDVWPRVGDLKLYTKFKLPKSQKPEVRKRLDPLVLDPYAMDLLERLLCLDPAQRLSAAGSLRHEYFHKEPIPDDLSSMLSVHTKYMSKSVPPVSKWVMNLQQDRQR